ncbi:MAG: efflux RND transporter periplasmic adaptor subunit [Verrucomicrobiae bacterium]|nr:efflux RND transporter periplasmic adaptor subunit [Verrucomicrobiae bacterium]NNJ42677.1 efflux RND transporter periplasmic adaptor subunit [Akkermansiaceae bacterium]
MKIITNTYKVLAIGTLTAILVSCNSDKKESASSNKEAKVTESSASTEVELHAVAECPTGEGCFICDSSKREAGRLWCKEHDRYEDRCFICHPDIKEPKRIYCSEHGVYEDECYLCHPELKGKKAGSKSSSNSAPASILMCKEHGVPERECAVCQPQLAVGLKPGESLKIRVASAEAMERVGVQVSKPEHTTARDAVSAYATVDYNQNKVAKITPLVEGIIREIKVVPGQKVAAGDILGTIHSSDFAEMKSRFLAASAARKLADLQVARERKLAAKSISAASELEIAEAAAEVAKVDLAAARQRLLNLSLSENEIDVLASDGRPTSLLTIRAPFAGTIVDRDASVGERIESGEPILVLADLSTMWLELSIPVRDAAGLSPGMEVSAIFSDLPDTVISGELVWIASAIDEKTRRIRARALIIAPPAALRKGLYGEARVQLGEARSSLAVPTTAIQTIDGVPFVFVRKESALYAATRVELTQANGSSNISAVRSGLAPDDLIVSQGSYILRSEFLKSLLGAGCVDD